MKYAKIINGKVDNFSLVKCIGYIEVPDNTEHLAVLNEDGSFTNPLKPEPTPPSKQEQLNTLIVTTTSNKRFYADPESRTDIVATLFEATSQGATDTDITSWKTADGIMDVTLAELREANKLALDAKAGIIGVL